MQRKTIYDVAKSAGVSTSTVSQVFNNSKSISAETAEKVRSIAERLNYRPRKKTTRREQGEKLRTLAFLTTKPSSVFGSPVYTRLLQYIEDIARQNNVKLIVRFKADAAELSDDIGGVFFLGAYDTSLDRILRRVPCVKIMGSADQSFPGDIVTDHKQQRDPIAANYFAQTQCEKIFIVSWKESEVPNIENSAPFVYPFRIYSDDNFVVDCGQVKSCVADILRQSRPYRKVGIFCVDDAILTHLHWELYHADQKHPGSRGKFELLCLNYAGSQAALLDPTPAFLHIHEDEIVRAAFDQLAYRIEHPASPRRLIQIVPTIVAAR